MQLYTNKDLVLIHDNLDRLNEKITENKKILFNEKDKRKELFEIYQIILDFISDNKRKIYGGYSQNKTIVDKNPQDAFYDPNDLPDIDFYSPDPINDLMKICNMLLTKGYENIEGSEAVHKETYKIYVNRVNVCDLSYVPANIYHKIPFIEIDKIYYTHPTFTMIDLYRMMTDPLFSAYRWEKIFPRLFTLQKHYPFNKSTSKLPNVYNIPDKHKTEVHKLLSVIFKTFMNNDSFIVYGLYAYNHLLLTSGIVKKDSKYKLLDVPFYECISLNYEKDAKQIYEALQAALPNNKNKIKLVEHYPFWMLLGYNAVIYYDDVPLLYISDYNNRCTPVKKVDAVVFFDGKVETGNKNLTVQIGCYDYIFLMNLITNFRAKVNGESDKINFHNIITSHLIEMRSYYFEKEGKTMVDETLFQEFIPDCVGPVPDPDAERQVEFARKKKEGKMLMFKYRPSEKIKEETTFKFANSSGNVISNTKNLRIL